MRAAMIAVLAYVGLALWATPARAQPPKPELVLQTGHTAEVTAVAFSPDSTRVATASKDGSVIVWNVATGQRVTSFRPVGTGFSTVLWVKGGNHILSRSYSQIDGERLEAWDAATGAKTFAGQKGAVASSDGRFVIDWSKDGGEVWDTTTGKRVSALREGQVRSPVPASFSPDGSRVAAPQPGGKIGVWDTATGQRKCTLDTKHSFVDVKRMAFSATGERLVAGVADGDEYRVAAWDTTTGKQLWVLKDRIPWYTYSLSPDGTRIVAVARTDPDADKRSCALWDANTGARIVTFTGAEWDPKDTKFSPEGRFVILPAERGEGVWDTRTGNRVGNFPGTEFTPDGRGVMDYHVGDREAFVIRTLPEGQVKANGRLPEPFEYGRATKTAAFSPDGTRVVTANKNLAILWDATTGRQLATFGAQSGDAVGEFGLAANSPVLATHVGKGYRQDGPWEQDTPIYIGAGVVVWDRDLGRPTRRLDGLQGPMFSLFSMGISPDGNRIYTIEQGGGRRPIKLVVRDPLGNPLGDTVLDKGDDYRPDFRLALSPDGSTVVTTLPDGNGVEVGHILDARTLAKKGTFKFGMKRERGRVAFSADGRRFVDWAGYAVWDVATGKEVAVMKAGGDVRSVALSPDARWALTGEWSTLVLWDATTGVLKKTIPDFPGVINCMTFTPDSTRLAVGCKGGAAQVWDALGWKKLLDLKGHTGTVAAVAFTPDGKHLLTGSFDGTARVWDPATGEELLRVLTFDGGRDWLVCTPDGLFDGSAAARDLVSYRVNGKVVPVNHFFRYFYKPGLLAAVMRGERPKPEVELAAQAPPKVRITTPKSGEVDEAVVQVTVEAEDQGGGAKTPWLKHGGALVTSAAQPVVEGKVVRRTFTVTLGRGSNTLEAFSACSDGSWESEPARVELTYAGPVEKPRLFLLCVGVGKYADEALALNFPAKDAAAVHDLFVRRGKQLYKTVEPVLLTDGKATGGNIRAAFKDLAGRATGNDVLVVFVAGHGALDGQRYYFLPADFRHEAGRTLAESARRYGITGDDLAELVGSVPARKRVVALDTCNAGGAAELFALRGREPAALRGAVERMNRATGTFVIAAAPANADAKESKELGHGLLTYALLAGFRAADGGLLKDDRGADPGPDGVADVLGVFTYAHGHVPRLMKHYFGREQDVQMGNYGTSFPLLPLRD